MKKVTYDIERFLNDFNKFLATNGMTQRCFSDISGLSISKVSRLVNRVSIPDERTIYKMAKIMEVSVSDYYIGEACVLNIDARDIHDMTIEEIDQMICKLKEVRREKIDAAWAELNAKQEYLKKLGALNDEV